MEVTFLLWRNVAMSKLVIGLLRLWSNILTQVREINIKNYKFRDTLLRKKFEFLSYLVRQLHQEFLRGGADVVQAFTFHSSDDKLKYRRQEKDVTVSVIFFNWFHLNLNIFCILFSVKKFATMHARWLGKKLISLML